MNLRVALAFAFAAPAACSSLGLPGRVSLGLAGCAPSRDTVPVVPETRVSADADATNSGGSSDGDGYVAIAKRPHVTIALASYAGVPRDAALLVLERLAAESEGCAIKLQEESLLARGAGRFTAKKKGTESVVDVRTEGGPRATHNAVLCFVAPLRSVPFPEGPENSTLVFEAIWNPL